MNIEELNKLRRDRDIIHDAYSSIYDEANIIAKKAAEAIYGDAAAKADSAYKKARIDMENKSVDEHKKFKKWFKNNQRQYDFEIRPNDADFNKRSRQDKKLANEWAWRCWSHIKGLS